MISKAPATTIVSHRGKDANTFSLSITRRIVNFSGQLGDVLLLAALVAMEVFNE